MASLREIAQNLKRELAFYRRIWAHPATPRLPRLLLGLALAYLLIPFDIIPDFLPVIGQLDDLVIVPGLVYLAVRMVPDEVIAACRLDPQSPDDTIDS
ncbi:MAG: DUF1232 domain-containing protein [Chloroflexi bacterium]|nr:YkvA family protein [Chloroflexota bacterium]MQC27287.1 DUF1232 domain-containing protein [Chloroflexota bacterium]